MDGRPKRRNKAAFSYFFSVVWTGHRHFISFKTGKYLVMVRLGLPK